MFSLIISIIFFTVGFFFLVITLYNLYYNNKEGYWLELNGKITKSKITKTNDVYSLGTDPYSSSTDVNYAVELEYQYTYENQKFSNSNIYYLDMNHFFLFSKAKKEFILKYPVGKKIIIYMDPNDKKNTFIEKKTPIVYTLVYALISLTIGVLFN